MPHISTLLDDIARRLEDASPFPAELVEKFSRRLAAKLAGRLTEERGPARLRLSNAGTQCERKLWYSIKTPDAAEPLSAATRLKFLIGDIWEDVLLFLAEAAGHEVTDVQKEVSLAGVVGHIDGKIDGVVVDVKSASPASFRRFKHGLKPEDDSFGYISQLGSYVQAEGQKEGYFLVGDKTLGHVCLDRHDFSGKDFSGDLKRKQEILQYSSPPPRGYEDEPDGRSGNRKLAVVCSYCPFKKTCWPGLRVFAYTDGPRFLTKVVKEPNVPELTEV